MKKYRFIENFLEFLILCILAYFFAMYAGKGVASHDRIVIVFFLAGSGLIISANFLLQSILLLNSKQTSYRYFLAKIKLFAIILIVSLFFTLLLGRDWFLFFSVLLLAIFIGYLPIIALLYIFDRFFQSETYKIWISQKRNRIIQYSITSAVLIVCIAYLTIAALGEIEEDKWNSCCHSNKLELYDTYIQQYPKGKYIEEATWRMTKIINNLADYDGYIKKYSNGQYIEEALFYKALLSKSKDAVNEYLTSYPSGIYKKPLELMLDSESGTFIDKRDGSEYRWVKIGEQIWMAQNLNYATPNSSSYEDNIQNDEIYGRRYSWDEASIACPDGWRLPDNNDWGTLEEYIAWKAPCTNCLTLEGSKLVPATNAMEDRKHHLLQTKNDWPNGNNATGFSAIPVFWGETYRIITWLSSSKSWINDFGHEYVNVWKLDDLNFGQSSDIKDTKFFIRCIKIK